jgi:hypothetical protein
MKNFTRLAVVLIITGSFTLAGAQDDDQALISVVNSNWASTNYTLLWSNINARLLANSADILGLSLKMNYYTHCDRNASNAYAAANSFTNSVGASARTELVPYAQIMAQRILNVPSSEFASFSATISNEVHSLFPSNFPGAQECEIFAMSFKARRDVHVQSVNPSTGVPIILRLVGHVERQTGTTSFSRVYYTKSSVTLTAPGTVNGKAFTQWNMDTNTFSTNANITITVSNNVTMTAVYEP